MRLQPIEKNFSKLFFERSSFHHSFSLEKFHDEDLSETLLKLFISCRDAWNVLGDVDLGTSLLCSILSRSLIAMAMIHTEHQLVSDLI